MNGQLKDSHCLDDCRQEEEDVSLGHFLLTLAPPGPAFVQDTK